MPVVPPAVDTVRFGRDLAQRMPLLQGPVWWHTVEQLCVTIESLRRTVGADLCTLFLYDAVTDELYARIVNNDGQQCEIALPVNLGLVGTAYTTRATVRTDAAYDDHRFYSGIDKKLGSRTRAVIATPIFTSLSTRPIG